jgi:hypothetical protein
MLMNLSGATEMIYSGKAVHIAGTENLLKRLPRGNWIGGTTEYFMADGGGRVSDETLFVTAFDCVNFRVETYSADNIRYVAGDAYDNGFSVVILPYDSEVHRVYAQSAPGFTDMFIKNIVGWVAGVNLAKPGQIPATINGQTGKTYADKAVVLHLEVPPEKTVTLNIINIFEQDVKSPVIEFAQEGFFAETCFVDGRKTALADYIKANNINIKLPLVGNYSGNGVNTSFKSIENGVCSFYAPVFAGIKYKIAKGISDYESEFKDRVAGHDGKSVVFSCNCILNFLYGGLEGKSTGIFTGPITFGEIAYQLVNQTLVYVSVE